MGRMLAQTKWRRKTNWFKSLISVAQWGGTEQEIVEGIRRRGKKIKWLIILRIGEGTNMKIQASQPGTY